MKILIAGASGTLGMPLIRALVAQGHSVAGLTRTPGKRAAIEKLGAAALQADAFDAAGLEAALRSASPDAVVNLLTAIPKNGPLRYRDMAATNRLRVEGTANLLRAAAAAGVKRMVGESMIFAYGFGDHGARALTESDPLQLREANAGLQEVVDALRSLEAQMLEAHSRGAIEAIPLRYGLFYGKDVPSTQSMLDAIRKRRFPIIAGADGIASWIYLDDAVQATIAALERGRSGQIYNLVDDTPVSLNEMTRHAAQLLRAKAPPSVPLWLIRLAMPYVAQFTSARLRVSNAKARSELGWQPQTPGYPQGLLRALG